MYSLKNALHLSCYLLTEEGKTIPENTFLDSNEGEKKIDYGFGSKQCRKFRIWEGDISKLEDVQKFQLNLAPSLWNPKTQGEGLCAVGLHTLAPSRAPTVADSLEGKAGLTGGQCTELTSLIGKFGEMMKVILEIGRATYPGMQIRCFFLAGKSHC